MKKILLALIAGITLLMTGSISAYEAHRGPIGLIYHDSDKTYEGYTLYTPLMGATTYLINMDGEVVHKWKHTGTYFWAQLLENGNLLVPNRDGYVREFDWDSNVVRAVRMDRPKDEAVAGSGGLAALDRHTFQHHDVRKIWNAKQGAYTYLYVTYNTYTEAEVLAHGADPARNVMVTTRNFATQQDSTAPKYSNVDLCGIAEVSLDGQLLWKWSIFDHSTYDKGIPAYDASADVENRNNAYDSTAAESAFDKPGRIDVNWSVLDNPREITSVGQDWLHTNSLDYNEETGHAIINAKHMSEIYIVDHQGTFVKGNPQQSIANAKGNSGDFLYRFGNPTVYAKNIRKAYSAYDANHVDTRWPGYLYNGHQQIWGAHDIHWARTDMLHTVGASINSTTAPSGITSSMWANRGNLLIFDNGVFLPGDTMSFALEWNPFISDKDGNTAANYVDPPTAGYTNTNYSAAVSASRIMHYSNQIVWRYNSVEPHSFYSAHISGIQRLPNGNTLICSGARGHIFEVAPFQVWNAGAKKYVTQYKSVWEFINPDGGTTMATESVDGTGYSVFRAQRYSPDHPAFDGKTLVPIGAVNDQSGPPTGFGFGGITTGGSGEGSGGSGGGAGGSGY